MKSERIDETFQVIKNPEIVLEILEICFPSQKGNHVAYIPKPKKYEDDEIIDSGGEYQYK